MTLKHKLFIGVLLAHLIGVLVYFHQGDAWSPGWSMFYFVNDKLGPALIIATLLPFIRNKAIKIFGILFIVFNLFVSWFLLSEYYHWFIWPLTKLEVARGLLVILCSGVIIYYIVRINPPRLYRRARRYYKEKIN